MSEHQQINEATEEELKKAFPELYVQPNTKTGEATQEEIDDIFKYLKI